MKNKSKALVLKAAKVSITKEQKRLFNKLENLGYKITIIVGGN